MMDCLQLPSSDSSHQKKIIPDASSQTQTVFNELSGKSRSESEATILSEFEEDEENVVIEEVAAEGDEGNDPPSEAPIKSRVSSAESCETVQSDYTIVDEAKPEMTYNTGSMDTLMNQGIRIFNLNPYKGLAFAQKKDLIHHIKGDETGNARRAAIFLRYTPGLNKEQIGKILGSEKREHMKMLENYLELFDFSLEGPTIRGLEKCLRDLFQCFKPSGEAQKIQRVVEVFSAKFNDDTASKRSEAEFQPTTTMLLAYSIIILNVDLHNPNNPRRMTKHEFVRNFRGLDEGNDLDTKEMEGLYDRILVNEIKHKIDRGDVTGNLFTNPDKCGWLYKKGATRFSKWRPRWFILTGNMLYYFKHSEDVEPLGFIPLENVLIQSCFDDPLLKRIPPRSAGGGSGGVGESSSASYSANYSSFGEMSIDSGGVGKRRSFRLKNTRSDFGAVLRHHNSSGGGSVETTLSGGGRRKAKRNKNFWFELHPWDERLHVKSARMSKKGGFVLGQHRTIKLRANSRQEMESWIGFLNRKGRFFNQHLQDMTMRARFQPDPSLPSRTSSSSLFSADNPGENKRSPSARRWLSVFSGSTPRSSNQSSGSVSLDDRSSFFEDDDNNVESDEFSSLSIKE